MKAEVLQQKIEPNMKELLETLCNDDGLKRKEARKSLVKYGATALPFVMELLDSRKHICRWEANKVIAEIGLPESIPVFLEGLIDDSSDIRWIASEGLIHTGKYSIRPLLELILDKHESVFVLNGAHHVIKQLNIKKLLPKDFPTEHMLSMLKVSSNQPELTVLVHKTLENMKND